ncbi:hypothetical protein [Ornithinicoccus halotolerans]|uniref:hypothetical protein n=1 Tax=Ornithinicoccus halotolerans TaxID=1748220 RepID=UPI0012976C2B|nr:hypothetical protein [Ornithinicoccus halotolerans]
MSSPGGSDPTRHAATARAASAADSRVVIVRPWTDAHGGGCCSGDTRDPVALDRRAGTPVSHHPAAHRVGECYQLLRHELPGTDVQIASPGNSAYLLPHVYRHLRPAVGRLRALWAAVQGTRAGAVLVDGRQVALLPDTEPHAVLAAVTAALRRPPTAG